MRELHFFDIDDEREAFALIRTLEAPSQAVRVPFMAPELPERYVTRQEQLSALRGFLLGLSSGSYPSTGVPVLALWGSSGSGKTALAIAAFHDEQVLDVFRDGVLWAHCGPVTNFLQELGGFYAALTGASIAFMNHEDAVFRLAEKLESRKCLIVLDGGSSALLKTHQRASKRERGGVCCS
jgi:hypothetical protein